MKPYGLEALIRWHHPEKGLIMPDSFIPLVEETKLIHLLTDWVLTNTLYKIKAFRALGIEVPISINVSAKNLYDPFFFERVMKNINSSGVDKKLIKFEITESVLMINPEESKNVLFMQKILINSQVRQIVKSAIQLSKDLGYKVVAEGVETAEVLDVLKEFNCDYAQGYYFAKPIASEEIEDWYRKALQP
jgi:EAL domain-containing protein (putative c-di-GMP-specific phosphodiesterase class I)